MIRAEAGDEGAIRPNNAKMPMMKECRDREFLNLFICKEYFRSHYIQTILALNNGQI